MCARDRDVNRRTIVDRDSCRPEVLVVEIGFLVFSSLDSFLGVKALIRTACQNSH